MTTGIFPKNSSKGTSKTMDCRSLCTVLVVSENLVTRPQIHRAFRMLIAGFSANEFSLTVLGKPSCKVSEAELNGVSGTSGVVCAELA